MCSDMTSISAQRGDERKMEHDIRRLVVEAEGELNKTLLRAAQTFELSLVAIRDGLLADVSKNYSSTTEVRAQRFVRDHFPVKLRSFHLSAEKAPTIGSSITSIWLDKEREAESIFSTSIDILATRDQYSSNSSTLSPTTTPTTTHAPVDSPVDPNLTCVRRSKHMTTRALSGKKGRSLLSAPDTRSPRTPAGNSRAGRVNKSKDTRQHRGYMSKVPSVSNNTIARLFVSSYIFTYGKDARYYILRCPKKDCHLEFSQHPLEENRAIVHFQHCQVDFTDEADIMQKYAQPVTRHQHGGAPVERSWVEKHNTNIRLQVIQYVRDPHARAQPVYNPEDSKTHLKSQSSMEETGRNKVHSRDAIPCHEDDGIDAYTDVDAVANAKDISMDRGSPRLASSTLKQLVVYANIEKSR